MFEQAAGLAVVAACYPPAMLIAALYLASVRPGRMAALYVIGGAVIVSVVGTAALLAIRDAGLSLHSQHHTRYGLRLALGVVALVAAVLIYRRRPKRPDPANPGKPGNPGIPGKPKGRRLVDKLSADPTPRTAFIVGVVMFGPSLTFIAAVQVVATAKASVAATVGAMVMIIVITLAFAWIPLVAYLIAPEFTARKLGAFEGWVRRHGKTIGVGAVALVGILLVAQGITGLV
ncbi:MAG TPA: GAP family protein [Streptosporangiaceae bacterium]|nr:GAP family protein [Streptosporangiaceae bacterium]